MPYMPSVELASCVAHTADYTRATAVEVPQIATVATKYIEQHTQRSFADIYDTVPHVVRTRPNRVVAASLLD